MSRPQRAKMRNVHGSRPTLRFSIAGISLSNSSAPCPLTRPLTVTGSSTSESSPHSRPKATGSCQIAVHGLETPGWCAQLGRRVTAAAIAAMKAASSTARSPSHRVPGIVSLNIVTAVEPPS